MAATPPLHNDVGRLRRVRFGARATLTLGIGASLAANVLAAEPSWIARIIAAWSPIALLLTVELLSRVPSARGWLSRLRITAAATIAVIAAWVSYWHIVEVAQTFGEATIAAHLLPLSIDGLVVVASVCLVELTERPETASPAATAEPVGPDEPKTPAARPVRRPSTGPTVRQLAAEHPEWTQARLAEAAGCSVRTVRRHLTDPSPPAQRQRSNGSAPGPGTARLL